MVGEANATGGYWLLKTRCLPGAAREYTEDVFVEADLAAKAGGGSRCGSREEAGGAGGGGGACPAA